MERKAQRKDREASGSGAEFTVVDQIKTLAAHNARAELTDEKQLLLFLQSWWSRTYNRPLKDPLLQSYSLEELLYEFYDRIERQKAEEERLEREDDKIEEDKERQALDWAEIEEKRELDKLKAQSAQVEAKVSQDPTKDPENVKWMEEEVRKAKQIFGESFGENIEENFDG